MKLIRIILLLSLFTYHSYSQRYSDIDSNFKKHSIQLELSTSTKGLFTKNHIIEYDTTKPIGNNNPIPAYAGFQKSKTMMTSIGIKYDFKLEYKYTFFILSTTVRASLDPQRFNSTEEKLKLYKNPDSLTIKKRIRDFSSDLLIQIGFEKHGFGYLGGMHVNLFEQRQRTHTTIHGDKRFYKGYFRNIYREFNFGGPHIYYSGKIFYEFKIYNKRLRAFIIDYGFPFNIFDPFRFGIEIQL